MQHLEALLAAAEQSDPVVDFLFTAAPKGTTSQWDRLELKASPSTAVAVSVAKGGGVRKAVAAMSVLTDSEAIDRFIRKDSRLAVRRVVATNPATSVSTLQFMLAGALKTGDSEIGPLVIDRLPVVDAFAVLDATTQTLTHEVNWFRPLAPRATSDELDLLLTCRFPDLAAAALANVCESGPVERIDDALARVALGDVAKAKVLWSSGGPRNLTHFQFVAGSGMDLDQHSKARWDYDAMLVMAESSNPFVCILPAAQGRLDDELVDRLLVHRSERVLTRVCERLRAGELAEKVARAVLELRRDPTFVPPTQHRHAHSRRYTRVPEAQRLVLLGLVSDDLAIDLLRTEDLSATVSWLTNSKHAKPAQFLALLEDPGWAFTPAYPATADPVVGYRAHEALLGHLPVESMLVGDRSPVTDTVVEHTRGLVKYWAGRSRSMPHFTRYLLGRLYESFGNDEKSVRLWEMWCKMASAHVGTIDELMSTVAATYGVPLKNKVPSVDAPVAMVQAKLF